MDGVKPRILLTLCLLRRTHRNKPAAKPTPAVLPKAMPTIVPVDDDPEDWPQTELLHTPDAHISLLEQADPSGKTAAHV